MEQAIINVLNRVLTKKPEELNQGEVKLQENLTNFIKEKVAESLSLDICVSMNKVDDNGISTRVEAALYFEAINEEGEKTRQTFSESEDSDSV